MPFCINGVIADVQLPPAMHTNTTSEAPQMFFEPNVGDNLRGPLESLLGTFLISMNSLFCFVFWGDFWGILNGKTP